MPLPAILGKAALSKLPWGKIIIGGIGLIMLATVLLLRHNLGNAREKIDSLQIERGLVAAELGVPVKDIMVKLKAVTQESKNRKEALERISAETLAAKKREQELDAKLKLEQEANAKRAKASQRVIDDLRARRSTGDAVKDLEQIEKDSAAAWKKWSQLTPPISIDTPTRGGLPVAGIVDDHVFGKPEYVKVRVTMEIHLHSHLLGIRDALIDRYKITERQLGGMRPLGFTYHRKADDVCEIHVVSPQINYQPAIVGHEALHCFYGGWHDSRM